MKPTNKLRFVERQEVIHGDVTLVRFLQQWWEKPVATMNLGWTGDIPLSKAEGEWRDVPTEQE